MHNLSQGPEEAMEDAMQKLSEGFKTGNVRTNPGIYNGYLYRFMSNDYLLGKNSNLLQMALNLVDTYEDSQNPLFLDGRTNDGFLRVAENDGNDYARFGFAIQQAILDVAYNNSRKLGTYSDSVLRGRKWLTSNFFPGPSEIANSISGSQAIEINASMQKYW